MTLLTQLKSNERVAAISKDFHVRRQNGKYVAYIVQDRYEKVPLLLGQKLSAIVRVINEMAKEDEVDTKVSVTGFYHKMHRKERTNTGGYLQRRWRIQSFSLEDAPNVFNSVRDAYTSNAATLIGSRGCYTTVTV